MSWGSCRPEARRLRSCVVNLPQRQALRHDRHPTVRPCPSRYKRHRAVAVRADGKSRTVPMGRDQSTIGPPSGRIRLFLDGVQPEASSQCSETGSAESGTSGSNPLSSSGESAANLSFCRIESLSSLFSRISGRDRRAPVARIPSSILDGEVWKN